MVSDITILMVGRVYAMGWNNKGQLGIGKDVGVSDIVIIEGLTGVVGVRCGYEFSIALTDDGSICLFCDP